MLRVGLTGELGSGKSTVAAMLAARGAIVLSSDEMARAMMQPGHAVFRAIVRCFGPQVLTAQGTLDRSRLAALAFDPAHPRVEELNAIVHPAVLHAQQQQIAALALSHPHAVVVVESALIFSTPFGVASRFHRILCVTAPEEAKIARFLERSRAGRELSPAERSTLEADARRRLAQQHSAAPPPECLQIHNDGDLAHLEHQVDALWQDLSAEAAAAS